MTTESPLFVFVILICSLKAMTKFAHVYVVIMFSAFLDHVVSTLDVNATGTIEYFLAS